MGSQMKAIIESIVLATTALAASCAAMPVQAAEQVTQERLLNSDKEAGNWLQHDKSYSANRFSSLKEINKSNVKNLRVAWTMHLGGVEGGGMWTHGGLEGTPIVENGMIYVTDGWGAVYKIDAHGGKGTLLWKIMIRWADRGLPFPLFQPDNLRSMVYVGNVVAGAMAILEASPAGVSTYILKDREDYSTRRIYSAICRELGKRPRFLPVHSAVVKVGGLISGDFRKVTGSFRVSSAKMERDFGFTPPFSLEEGILRTVQWYKLSEH